MADKITTDQLTDTEYNDALRELAEYDKQLTESDRLTEEESLRRAETLNRLFNDARWIVERNAERAATAKTPAGGRPVDPASRSQFSTWVRGRFNRIEPRRTYQLLDAHRIATEFLERVQITPTAEYQLRPLKKLTAVAYGSGKRIPEVWEMACELAISEGYDEPTKDHVRRGILEWNHQHLTGTQQRREDRYAKAERLRIRALAAWHAFVEVGTKDQINAVIDAIQTDLDRIEQTGRP